MRKIKFRGKCHDTQEWLYGDLIANSAASNPLIKPMFIDCFTSTEPEYVDASTVGQFTGLYDNNGKEIYEGDILQEVVSNKMVIVAYEAPQFCYSDNEYGYKFLNHPENFVIIGNIHDNPELLKRK